MNALDHDQVRARLAEGDIDADVAAHLDACDECTAWERRLAAVLDLAPHLYEPVVQTTSAVDRVIGRTHRRRAPRGGWIAAAAAAVMIAVAGGVMFATREPDRPDRIADAAAALTSAGSFRFVVEVDATVAVPVNQLAPTDTATFAIAPVGRCDLDGDVPVSSDRDDLVAILDALMSQDPCTALEVAGDTLDPAVHDTATRLQAAAAAWQHLASLPDPAVDAASAIESSTVALVRTEAEQRLATIVDSADTLEQAATRAAESTGELAAAQTAGDQTDTLRPTALADLRTLTELTQATPVAGPADRVEWELLATGTWNPDQPEAAGTADVTFTDTRLADGTTADVAHDPTGVLSALFADPGTLIALVDSAPASTADTITWTVPDQIVAASQLQGWQATVYLTASGAIDRIELTATSAAGTVDVSAVITIAR